MANFSDLFGAPLPPEPPARCAKFGTLKDSCPHCAKLRAAGKKAAATVRYRYNKSPFELGAKSYHVDWHPVYQNASHPDTHVEKDHGTYAKPATLGDLVRANKVSAEVRTQLKQAISAANWQLVLGDE